MRTKLFTTLAMATVLASCSSDEVVNIGAESTGYNMIGFTPYSSLNLTRGIPVADNDAFSAENNTFEAVAYINIDDVTSAYLSATIEADESEAWDYQSSSETQFWPESTQTLDFYAYANEGGNTVSTSKAAGITSSYTVPATIADQKDFMYAAVPGVCLGDMVVSAAGAVPLHFRHALTQINFTTQVTGTDLYLEIEKISMGNINSAGTFTVAASANTNTTVKAVCSWASQATPLIYSIANVTATTPITSTSGTGGVVAINNDADGSELMLMPQTFSAWAASGSVTATGQAGAYILVSCKLYKKLDNVNVYYIGSGSAYGSTAIAVSSDSGDTTYPEWIGGRNITYHLSFGADPTGGTTPGGGKDPETGDDLLVPISFTTTVEDWVDVTSTSLTM